MAKKILFITHDSSRSGAPMLLLYLLKWLKENKPQNWIIDSLTLEKGPLDQDFKEVSNFFTYYYPRYISRKDYYLNRLLHRSFDYENFYKNQFYKNYSDIGHDIIYANSVVSIPMAIQLKNNSKITPKIICNIHELPTVINTTVKDFRELAKEVDLFIAGSNLVAETIIENYGVDRSKIKVVYDFTDLSLLPVYKEKKSNATFTIGAMGAMNWRKGNDLFLLVAFTLKKKYPDLDIRFEWMGSKPFMEKEITENDIIKCGLDSDYIQYTNSSPEYREFFTRMDILLLTSREDPFPLVAIEAGAYGLPLITFEKATGINEILKKNQGGGFVVPYLDIDAVVEKIAYYYHHRDQIKKDSDINRESFKGFTVENSGVEVLNIIKSI